MNLWTTITGKTSLEKAWKQVKSNKPSPGINNITYEQFDNNREIELTKLSNQLREESYQTSPVKLVEIKENDKIRTIGLFCMKDKVVQKVIANNLTGLFNKIFSRSCYGFRPNRSAMKALNLVDKLIKKDFPWVLKTDILSFFENINHNLLFEKLTSYIEDERVINLIKKIVISKEWFDGEQKERKKGVCQGSSLSPFLSNLYLNDFDHLIGSDNIKYIRYVDDLLFLSKEKNRLEKHQEKIIKELEKLDLSLKNKKTKLKQKGQGFIYLGFKFNEKGKGPAKKATKYLYQNLKNVWENNNELPAGKRIEKINQIYQGWEQYYCHKNMEVDNLLLYLILIQRSFNNNKKEKMNKLKFLRSKFMINDKKVSEYLLPIWQAFDYSFGKLKEYEVLFDCSKTSEKVSSKQIKLIEALNEQYEILIGDNKRLEVYDEIIQLYTDVALYQKASKIFEKKKLHLSNKDKKNNLQQDIFLQENREKPFKVIVNNNKYFQVYKELFVGRTDIYARAILNNKGKREYHTVREILENKMIKQHLKGNKTIATFIKRNNDTVKYLILDIDISKKIILKNKKEHKKLDTYWREVFNLNNKITKIVNNMGLNCYHEHSGYRGVHLWIFFENWIPVNKVKQLGKLIKKKLNFTEGDLNIELFPDPEKRDHNQHSQAMKMPFGKHLYSNNFSFFFDRNGEQIIELKDWLLSIEKNSMKKINNILETNKINKHKGKFRKVKKYNYSKEDIVQFNIYDRAVLAVLKGCSLMRYLCFKARDTKYLNHQERVSLSLIFCHIGKPGQVFLHKIIGHTLNYEYEVTQKFINTVPEKPVSCIRLREQYQKLTAHISCNCIFNELEECYPSPVIHALNTTSSKNITIPKSRDKTEKKDELIRDNLNITKKVGKITKHLIELKKQKKGVLRSINKCEKKLGFIFDNNDIKNIEIELGTLKRLKSGEDTEWIIEI